MNFKHDVVTNKFTKNLDWKKKINRKKYVMLHHTWLTSTSVDKLKTLKWESLKKFEDKLLKNMTDYLSINKAQVSVHYVVWTNWDLSRIWTDDYVLWHAWRWDMIEWIKDNMNNFSIWIEVISDWKYFTDRQRETVRSLIKELADTHWIKVNNIIRHLDYTSRKTDIWDNFWNWKYKSFSDYTKSVMNWDSIKDRWLYEWIFWDNYWIKWTIYNDLEWWINKLVDKEWKIIDWKEFMYFIQIWLERIKKDFNTK